MGTTFQQIYNLSNVIRKDPRLKNKPSNLIYRELYGALIFSVSEFVADCYKDISSTNRSDFEEKEYVFQATLGMTDFLLETPPVDFTDIYVKIDDTTINYTYSYDDVTSMLTISPALLNPCEVYVSVFKKGSFNVDLNDVEMVILAEGVNIPFLEEQRNRNDLLTQMVYNNDGRIYSQQAHLQTLNDTIKMQYNIIVRPKINDYSYKFSPNRNLGLSGRPNYVPTRNY